MYRHYVFTINNPAGSPEDFLEKFRGKAKYCIFQLEKGEAGTPHYQGIPGIEARQNSNTGYVEFAGQKRNSYCQKNFAKGYWAARERPRQQARDYCRKRDGRIAGPWELGEWTDKGQGRRSDIQRMVDHAKAGKSYDAIVREVPQTAVRYTKGLREVVRVFEPKRQGDVHVSLIHDRPGVGKSTYVHRRFGSEAFWLEDGKWFDGYDRQPVIVLDEYRGNLNFRTLLRILRPIHDVLQVETKGSHCRLFHNQVWITANLHPRDWHDWTTKNCQHGYEALRVRIDDVYEMDGYDVTPLNKDAYF